MKKYRVTVNGTAYEIQLEELTGAAPAASAPAAAPAPACGICTLMRELGLYDLVPAMCRLDYIMAEAGGTSDLFREYTLASGGPYCDCGYKKKRKGNGRKRK